MFKVFTVLKCKKVSLVEEKRKNYQIEEHSGATQKLKYIN